MKQITQYIYKHEFPDFTYEVINKGITLCRRLGWEPYAIILGKKETAEIKCFTHTGVGPDSEEGVSKSFKVKIKHNNEETYLGFQCEPRNLEKEREEIRELIEHQNKKL